MLVISLNPQERAGVKMVMIQDGPQNTGADKPLRISGEPFKVQVGSVFFVVSLKFFPFGKSVFFGNNPVCLKMLHFWSFLYSKPKKW